MTKHWIERIESRIGRWLDRGVGRAWVVAVSGGSDSVGLLRALCHLAEPLGLRLSVAHLDHGVRGPAGRGDAAFVTELANRLGVPIDLGQWQPTREAHFEADGRAARYQWLTAVARSRGASAVAVGHTRDDQAETILHRILRGTGPHGLTGIPARRTLAGEPRVFLLRPLLTVSRRGIRAFLSAIGQPFREDETNTVISRTRARIRHDLLPKLAEEYNPAVSAALVRLGALSARQARVISREARAALQGATVAADGDSLALDHGFLRAKPRFLVTEILRLVFRRAGWPEGSMSARRWLRLASLIGRDQFEAIEIGARVVVSSDGSLLLLRRLPNAREPEPLSGSQRSLPLLVPGRTTVPWAHCRIDAQIDGPSGGSVSEVPLQIEQEEVVDFDQVAPPLFVRAPLPGDRFDPLGMDGRSKALADFFRGRRVSRAIRARTPLVCDQRGIVWVAGHRLAERVKETSRTQRRLWLSCRGVAGEDVVDSGSGEMSSRGND